MIDAMGQPQTALLLGGTSELGLASIEALAAGGRLQAVVLAGRPSERLDAAVERVRAAGVADVTTVGLDATETGTHDTVLDEAFGALGDVDVTIVAVGVLGDQEAFEADPDAAVDAAMANYVGPLSLCLRLAPRLRAQGHGSLVVLSSVAAERPRRSLFVYGSTKAGLDAFATGLGDALHGSGVTVTVVRPGYVRTRMTEGKPEAPFATDADVVGRAVADAVRRRKELVHVPGPLRVLMLGLRSVPRSLFRRLPL